ncbi:hypothetical protein JI739_10725 [Ramlibacter sp. AW1]|uniref:Uncharacterized protein n=1 Tax=Ramlibacter aurantiacus TaxID=2801330 RepID=A0A937D6C8_9BURK|nr:hypothetical protein [Ramlibacter aurantiacus]MBL0420818.1 hypothetical protein [Ramlibacter aurantiacus]
MFELTHSPGLQRADEGASLYDSQQPGLPVARARAVAGEGGSRHPAVPTGLMASMKVHSDHSNPFRPADHQPMAEAPHGGVSRLHLSSHSASAGAGRAESKGSAGPGGPTADRSGLADVEGWRTEGNEPPPAQQMPSNAIWGYVNSRIDAAVARGELDPNRAERARLRAVSHLGHKRDFVDVGPVDRMIEWAIAEASRTAAPSRK